MHVREERNLEILKWNNGENLLVVFNVKHWSYVPQDHCVSFAAFIDDTRVSQFPFQKNFEGIRDQLKIGLLIRRLIN